MPGISEELLVKLRKAVYGLSDDSLPCLRSTSAHCESLGSSVSLFGSCLPVFVVAGRLCGAFRSSADDTIGRGDDKFDKCCVALRSSFLSGKWTRGSGRYRREEVRQWDLLVNKQLSKVADDSQHSTKDFDSTLGVPGEGPEATPPAAVGEVVSVPPLSTARPLEEEPAAGGAPGMPALGCPTSSITTDLVSPQR